MCDPAGKVREIIDALGLDIDFTNSSISPHKPPKNCTYECTSNQCDIDPCEGKCKSNLCQDNLNVYRAFLTLEFSKQKTISEVFLRMFHSDSSEDHIPYSGFWVLLKSGDIVTCCDNDYDSSYDLPR
jgi:hypothetical protein